MRGKSSGEQAQTGQTHHLRVIDDNPRNSRIREQADKLRTWRDIRISNLEDRSEDRVLMFLRPAQSGEQLIVDGLRRIRSGGSAGIHNVPTATNGFRDEDVPPSGGRSLRHNRKNSFPEHPVGGNARNPLETRPLREPDAAKTKSERTLTHEMDKNRNGKVESPQSVRTTQRKGSP